MFPQVIVMFKLSVSFPIYIYVYYDDYIILAYLVWLLLRLLLLLLYCVFFHYLIRFQTMLICSIDNPICLHNVIYIYILTRNFVDINSINEQS